MILVGCSSQDADEATTDGAGTIESYISAYNDGDLDAVMTDFTQDSVIAGHPTSIRLASHAGWASARFPDVSLLFQGV
jgi:hypothetical protein